MDCVFKEHERLSGKRCRYKCMRCGFVTAATKSPIGSVYVTCKMGGAGDFMAHFLKAFGIRKKKGCGCGKRQQKMNQAHGWCYRKAASLADLVKRCVASLCGDRETVWTARWTLALCARKSRKMVVSICNFPYASLRRFM